MRLVSIMSLQEKIAQMLLVGIAGTTEDNLQSGGKELLQMGVNVFLRETRHKYGGDPGERECCNIEAALQLSHLTSYMRSLSQTLPPFIAIQAEGGLVRRLETENGFDLPMCSPLEMGTQPDECVREIAGQIGLTCMQVGINFNLAPSVDLFHDGSFMANDKRIFHKDGEVVCKKANAFLSGLAINGVMGCLKHFPGQGCVTHDTHKQLEDISQCYPKIAQVPFFKLAPLASAIMVGHVVHNVIDLAPASLSNVWIPHLRKILKFGGIIVTDCLQADSIAKYYSLEERLEMTLKAGANLLLYTNHINTLNEEPDNCDKVHQIIEIIMKLAEKDSAIAKHIHNSAKIIEDKKRKLRLLEL